MRAGVIDPKEVWCVRHSAGWCACAVNRKPAAAATSVQTLCGHYVILPIGIDKREPDCPKCEKKLSGGKKRSKEKRK